MKLLYNKANLIHCDLSENNILWHKNECYFLNLSNARHPTTMHDYFFLMNDCTNISKVSIILLNP